jgi:hypothetical protein
VLVASSIRGLRTAGSRFSGVAYEASSASGDVDGGAAQLPLARAVLRDHVQAGERCVCLLYLVTTSLASRAVLCV